MCGQITDVYWFKSEKYSLIEQEGPEVFSPETFGMVPAMFHTACRRGFHAEYEIA